MAIRRRYGSNGRRFMPGFGGEYDFDEDYHDRTIDKKWFKKKTLTETFWTPYGDTKRSYKTLNDESIPASKDIVEYLNKDNSSELRGHSTAIYFMEYDPSKAVEEAKELPAGIYNYQKYTSSLPERLVEFKLRDDEFLNQDLMAEFPACKDIKAFLSNHKAYKENGLLYKLGILMYGSPGQGKTFLLRYLLEEVIPKEKAAVIFCPSQPTNSFLTTIKDTLGDILKVFIFEELITWTRHDENIYSTLNFLDGELSPDNAIILATTNYPEKLPQNIVDRPSRFDKLYKFGNPKADFRKGLLESYLKKEYNEDYVKNTEDLSVAEIRELCMSMRVNKLSFPDALKAIQDRKAIVKKVFQERSSIVGF